MVIDEGAYLAILAHREDSSRHGADNAQNLIQSVTGFYRSCTVFVVECTDLAQNRTEFQPVTCGCRRHRASSSWERIPHQRNFAFATLKRIPQTGVYQMLPQKLLLERSGLLGST